MAGWTVGLLLTGVSYGSIGADVKSLIGNSGLATELFVGGSGDLVDGFYATAGVMMALIASGFTVSSVLRPRAEEEDGRLEALVATAMPRRRWWLSNVLITTAGSALVVSAAGSGMGLGFGLSTGDWGRFGDLLGATVVMLPAVLVLGGVAMLVVATVPRWGVLSWLGLTLCAVVLLFAVALRLPDWLVDLSPFSHLGRFPVEPVPWPDVGIVLLVAVALGALAVRSFARRDLVCR